MSDHDCGCPDPRLCGCEFEDDSEDEFDPSDTPTNAPQPRPAYLHPTETAAAIQPPIQAPTSVPSTPLHTPPPFQHVYGFQHFPSLFASQGISQPTPSHALFLPQHIPFSEPSVVQPTAGPTSRPALVETTLTINNPTAASKRKSKKTARQSRKRKRASTQASFPLTGENAPPAAGTGPSATSTPQPMPTPAPVLRFESAVRKAVFRQNERDASDVWYNMAGRPNSNMLELSDVPPTLEQVRYKHKPPHGWVVCRFCIQYVLFLY